MPLQPGSRLGSYEILAPLGAGGMGEVYRARHLKLGREVAIKVLPASVAEEPERLARFEREARTASALNHPNIVTIYDIATDDGVTYIAMELVEGRTVRDLIKADPLEVEEVLELATQIADGLGAAHEAGIVHRDVKPENVMVTPDGLVKILDFGLAKPLATDPDGRVRSITETVETAPARILGTPHYMAPEQLAGDDVDHRTDQFAFGVLVHEMVTGDPPFEASSLPAVITAILTRPTPPLRRQRKDVPVALDRLVGRCLEKAPDDRFPSTGSMAEALSGVVTRRRSIPARAARALRRPAVAASVAAVVLCLVAGALLWAAGADRRWAEEAAAAEIASLIETGALYQAYRTALTAREYRPDDPELSRLMERITLPVRVDTEPPGARVLLREYAAPDAEWLEMGVTPLDLRIPYELVRWRIEKEGYEPFEGAPFGGGALRALAQGLSLEPVGERPDGMVRVAGGPAVFANALPASVPVVELEPFYLDRYEVTNRAFAEFIDAGGYRTPDWWPSALTEDASWEEAVDAFRDPTGRFGPATWELGDYPDGEDDHPVRGISWFEAAAYCAFAGKSLPTLYHWFHAIGQAQRSDILLHSNLDGTAPAPVGEFRGITAYGAYDMAGNVKEWVWNAADGDRYILGGAWNEPTYLFKRLIAHDPGDRSPTHGVRCARRPEQAGEGLEDPVVRRVGSSFPDPMGDQAFQLLVAQYAYDPDPLESRVEAVDTLAGHVRKTVSFTTAYDDERMEVHLLLPRDVEPPYQTVIWFPGDDVFTLRSSERFSSAWLFDFLPRAGRAVAVPVYRGMYERFEPWERTPNDWRDMVISWARDIGRTIDYLETDPVFDDDAIAYYGFSAGALYAPVFAVVEPRIELSMFVGGGSPPEELHPAMQPAHFAPRMETPTLMINGRDDFLVPYEASQRPFFELIGTDAEDKRHARLPGGHIPSDPRDIMREVMDWLDRYLGPVGASQPPSLPPAG